MKAVLTSSRFDISNNINLQPMRGRLGGWMVGARLGGDMSGVSVSGMFDLDQGISVLREMMEKYRRFGQKIAREYDKWGSIFFSSDRSSRGGNLCVSVCL